MLRACAFSSTKVYAPSLSDGDRIEPVQSRLMSKGTHFVFTLKAASLSSRTKLLFLRTLSFLVRARARELSEPGESDGRGMLFPRSAPTAKNAGAFDSGPFTTI